MSLCAWWLQHTSFLPHYVAQSDCLSADHQGQGDTRLTLMPSIIPNSNYVIMVSDWNCLKYFCLFFCTVLIRCTETFWSPFIIIIIIIIILIVAILLKASRSKPDERCLCVKLGYCFIEQDYGAFTFCDKTWYYQSYSCLIQFHIFLWIPTQSGTDTHRHFHTSECCESPDRRISRRPQISTRRSQRRSCHCPETESYCLYYQ
jgi:hypothetical protein